MGERCAGCGDCDKYELWTRQCNGHFANFEQITIKGNQIFIPTLYFIIQDKVILCNAHSWAGLIILYSEYKSADCGRKEDKPACVILFRKTIDSVTNIVGRMVEYTFFQS